MDEPPPARHHACFYTCPYSCLHSTSAQMSITCARPCLRTCIEYMPCTNVYPRVSSCLYTPLIVFVLR